MELTIQSAIAIAGRTAASLFAGAPAKAVLLIAALLFCFAGYRLLPCVSALYGVVAGIVLAACATSLLGRPSGEIPGLALTVALMVVFGLVLGVLFFQLYPVGMFAVCASIGAAAAYVPALFAAEFSRIAFWTVLVVCAVLFGVTGVLFLRPAAILTTSLFGFAASAALMELLGGRLDLPAVLVGLGLSVAGFAVQRLTNRAEEARGIPARSPGEEPEAAGGERRRLPVIPGLLVAAALALAAVGIYYVEIVLALAFACYLQKHYRTAAFAFAILCVRRVVDIALCVLREGTVWGTLGMDTLSAAVFLALTAAAVHAWLRVRHAEDDTNVE